MGVASGPAELGEAIEAVLQLRVALADGEHCAAAPCHRETSSKTHKTLLHLPSSCVKKMMSQSVTAFTEMVILLGLARRAARQIEKVSLFYQCGGEFGRAGPSD